jgi:phospholipid/cholesterol/gamma-HCH transport system permease protein
MGLFSHIGKFSLLIARTFSKPEKMKIFWRQLMFEIDSLGIGSLGIIAIISFFMGAVITIQTSSNIDSAFIPAYTVGFTVRQSMILEFAPTIIALILAGKVGSNIASEIGTMRVSEQIDALEIMGINSASYLILPKITAAIIINPFLVIISMFIGMAGGYIIAWGTGIVTTSEYIYGLEYDFRVFGVYYALIKTIVFAFIITAVPSYYGYYTKGGSLAVGVSSTKAVVTSSIVILLANYVLTQLLLI